MRKRLALSVLTGLITALALAATGAQADTAGMTSCVEGDGGSACLGAMAASDHHSEGDVYLSASLKAVNGQYVLSCSSVAAGATGFVATTSLPYCYASSTGGSFISTGGQVVNQVFGPAGVSSKSGDTWTAGDITLCVQAYMVVFNSVSLTPKEYVGGKDYHCAVMPDPGSLAPSVPL